MRNIVFLGPPGSGKGTQAKQLVNSCGYIHLSTGNLLREEIKTGSLIGKQVSELIQKGLFVRDDFVFEIVKQFIQNRLGEKILFDGYPRSVKQAETLDKFLESLDSAVHMVVYFEVDVESISERIRGRITCSACGAVYHTVYNPPRASGKCDECGETGLVERVDDALEVFKQRVEIYKKETEELVRTYEQRNLLRRVNASGEIEAVTKEINALICS